MILWYIHLCPFSSLLRGQYSVHQFYILPGEKVLHGYSTCSELGFSVKNFSKDFHVCKRQDNSQKALFFLSLIPCFLGESRGRFLGRSKDGFSALIMPVSIAGSCCLFLPDIYGLMGDWRQKEGRRETTYWTPPSFSGIVSAGKISSLPSLFLKSFSSDFHVCKHLGKSQKPQWVGEQGREKEEAAVCLELGWKRFGNISLCNASVDKNSL